jgi:nucleoside-diphosphate-sugar epimerase
MAVYSVLGATGFVGARIVRQLHAAGLNCYVPGRGDAGIFERDLGRVFYCIGLTADYARRPFDTVRAHVAYLADILEKAQFESLVYLSSTRLYDNLASDIASESADLTFQSANPRHMYDLSKALGENLCLTASQRASVARLSCVYDAAPGAPGFLSELLQRLPTGRELKLDSSSGLSRDYVSLDDTVAALKAILDSGRREIFNVASGENVSNEEIAQVLNARGWQISFARHAPKQLSCSCDVTKLKALRLSPMPVRDYLNAYVDRLQP